MSTLQTWVDATRRHLLAGRVVERNTLAANYTAGSGTMTFTNTLGGIVAGSMISIGLNTLYVAAVTPSSNTATVIGGQDGSTDANASSGSLVRVNPRFTDFAIADALTWELADLSSPANDLYRVAYVDLSVSDTTVGYDLAGVTNLIDIIEVRAHNSASTMKDYTVADKLNYRLNRTADGSVFPSGLSLQVMDTTGNLIGTSWGLSLLGTGTTRAVRVIYKTAFTAPVNLTDDLTTTGLPTTAWDIPPIGAAARLMMPMEVRRNDLTAQGDSRRANEVPPGAELNAARTLMTWRSQRVAAESARLAAAYPAKRW